MTQLTLRVAALVSVGALASAQSQLDRILAGGVAPARADLQAMQDHVQSLIENCLPATVSLPGASGVIVEGGFVLTSGHVSREPGRKLSILLHDGRRIEGETLGANHRTDTGLVKILTAGEFPSLAIGPSSELGRGEWCLQLGHPSGAKPGRSAPARLGRVLHVPDGDGWVVTDCTMQGGDSGGPLIDMQGRVIGINSRIASNLAQNMHTPSDAFTQEWDALVKSEVVGSMRRSGRRRQPRFGALWVRKAKRATVRKLKPDLPAAQAGLEVGDVILQIDGEVAGNHREVAKVIARAEEEVELQVQRGEDVIDITVELADGRQPVLDGSRLPGLRSLRSHQDVMNAFAEITAVVNASTAIVEQDGERVGYGTVVRADGIVVTKASELEDGEIICSIDDVDLVAERVGTDDTNDLAVLRVTPEDKLNAIEWADAIPDRGAWLASADGAGWPAAIGVLSSAPYSHTRAYLGVNLEPDSSPPSVQSVVEESAASRAGIQDEDVVLSIDDVSVEDSSALIREIRKFAPGAAIKLRIRRGDDELELGATLGRNLRGGRSRQQRVWGPLSDVRSGFGLVLQHDSVLRPNQCGGPVVGLDGKAVGVNVSRAGRVETLAIPRATVEEVVAQVLAAAGSK